MNFGEYLRSLLFEKGINLTTLAKNTGIKSKNELYRLFENKYSYNKTLELTERIFGEADFSAAQKKKLYALMEECKITPSARNASVILGELYKKQKVPQDRRFEKVCRYIEKNAKKKMLMFFGKLTDKESGMLSGTLSRCESGVSAKHIISFNTSDEGVAESLFAFITLFKCERYCAFEASKPFDYTALFIVENGNEAELAVYDGAEFVKSRVSIEMAEFIVNKLNMNCKKPLKTVRGKVADYVDIMKSAAEIDVNNMYSFFGMQCFGDVPFDIMYGLFEEAEFFGFPREHPYVVGAVEAMKKRSEQRQNSKLVKRYFLSEKLVEEFLESGKVPDFMPELRPLEKCERVKMLERFLKYDGGVKFWGRFFRNEYTTIDVETVYIENMGIYVSNSPRGYDKHHAQAIITHPKAVRVFKSFAERFWESGTVPDEESRARLEAMCERFCRD